MIKTTNEADHICEGLTCDIDVPEDTDGDPSFVLVQVNQKNVYLVFQHSFMPIPTHNEGRVYESQAS